MQPDIAGWTEAASRGDGEALRRLLEHYLPDVRAFVRLRAGPLVRRREESGDLVQSVCREVLEHAQRFAFPHEGAFRAWLFTTALRKIRDRQDYHLAARRDVAREVEPESAAAPDLDGRLLERYGAFSTPSGGARLREELERVERAFDALTEEQREVVTLAHLAGLPRAEIAARLDKSEGAVRVVLHRALARLARLLEAPS